jgi:thiol-disulfide isomerase/thioredoxin
MIQKLILILTVVLSGIGCSGRADQALNAPVAKEIISDDSVSVDVFSFEEFSKWLTPTSDTTYVFNFWATWCRPCVAELPVFEEFGKDYSGKKVKLILVNLDSRKMAIETLLPFIKRKKLEQKVILLDAPDFNSWLNMVSPEWEGSIPATYVVKGKKFKFYEKTFEYETLEKAVLEIYNL